MWSRRLLRASAGAAGAAFALAAPSTALLESRLNSTPTDSATNSVLEGQQTPREAFKRATPAKSAAAADFADAVAEEAASGRPIFVGIAGGTGSGKTTVAAAIAARVGPENLVHISHDSYYRDLRHLSADERARTNFDHPDSLETSLLVDHLRALRAGRSVDVPVYDFSAHARTDDTERKRPAKIVLVEGILIYSAPELRELLDIKIFVDTEADVRFIRRLRRDIVERARSYDSVVAQCAARAIRAQIRRNSAQLSDGLSVTSTGTSRRCGRCTCSSSSRRRCGPTSSYRRASTRSHWRWSARDCTRSVSSPTGRPR